MLGDVLEEAADLGDLARGGAVDRGAAQSVAGLGAAAEQGAGVDRRDRAVDLDVEIIGLDARGAAGSSAARPRRTPQLSEVSGSRSGLPPVTTGSCGVELDVAAVGGDAVGDAIGADRGRDDAADRRAGIDDLLVEARRRAEQFADAGRAEALRPGAAEEQVLDRLPVDAGAERRRRARCRIIGIARGAGQLEAVEEGRVAQQGQAQFGIGLV